jgi:Tfp pilus assembly protein PilP
MSPSLLLQQPFIQITLPILIGFVAVGVWQNKRIDDLRAYLREFRAEMNSRLDPFRPHRRHA